MNMLAKKAKKGFTIVELVIVIAVIAILAAVLIPTFTSVIENANESAAMQESKNEWTNYLSDIAADGDYTTDTYYVVHYDSNDTGDYYFVVSGGQFETEAKKYVATECELTGGLDYTSDNGNVKIYSEAKAAAEEAALNKVKEQTLSADTVFYVNVDDGAYYFKVTATYVSGGTNTYAAETSTSTDYNAADSSVQLTATVSQ